MPAMANITDDFSTAAARPACPCMASDPLAARAAIGKAKTTDSLIDESHFIVSLLQCASCGQRFLDVFTEKIDWIDGDDSQAWMYVPISAQEAALLRSAGAKMNETFLLETKLHRRFLSVVYPSGGEKRTVWGTGPLVILPHD